MTFSSLSKIAIDNGWHLWKENGVFKLHRKDFIQKVFMTNSSKEVVNIIDSYNLAIALEK